MKIIESIKLPFDVISEWNSLGTKKFAWKCWRIFFDRKRKENLKSNQIYEMNKIAIKTDWVIWSLFLAVQNGAFTTTL